MKHYGVGDYKIHDKEGNKYTLTVDYDECGFNPRDDYSNTSTIWCWSRHYNIGDDIPNNMSFSESLEYLCDELGIDYTDEDADNVLMVKLQESGKIVTLPIHCYEHGGITISILDGYPYNDRWDSYIIGYAFIKRADMDVSNVLWAKKAYEIIKAEVEELDYCCRGDIYWYKITTEDNEDIDSCGGFLGDCLEDNGIVEMIPFEAEFDD